MKAKRIVIGAAAIVIGLPVAFVLIAMASVSILNRTNGAILSSGQQREYLLHVPDSYDRARPTPLVISLHGANGWPAQQMNVSRWNRLADEQGFIVVYPSGHGVPRIWHASDAQFISELIDTLEAAYNIDPTRIYANGLSQGGSMAFVLSCTLNDRIAAVGIAAGAQERPSSWCADHRPMPMISFHGTADPIVPYVGGRNPIGPGVFPSVLTWTADWARRNRCGANPGDSTVAPDVTRREYTHCANDAGVVLYTVRGGGHQWPGGKPMPTWLVGPASNGVDATRQMWTFFREHPRTHS